MCPRGARLLTGQGGVLEETTIVAHCLVLESEDGLILVDTGYGTGDVQDPSRLGRPFRTFVRPSPTMDETAIRQVEALGHKATDVRHVISTHLDPDHAGGLSDFPHAKVHVFATELAMSQSPPLAERARYIQKQWAHGPDWVEHEVDGDSWFGFESVKPIPGLDDDVALVPLVGHSVGHTGVAVRTGDGWLLHCGDAFFFHGEIETPPRTPAGVKLFENVTQHDRGDRIRNQERLRELQREHGGEVRLVCSHDPRMFEECSGASVPA